MNTLNERTKRQEQERLTRKHANARISNILYAAFLLASAFTLMVGVTALLNIRQNSVIDNLVAHTQTALERLSQTRTQLIDSETAQRGYIITSDPKYLEPYNNAVGAIPSGLTELRRLTADNPLQQMRLDKLEPLVRERLVLIDKTIMLRRTSGFEAAAQVIKSDRGRFVMDQIRGIIISMESEERDLLTKRTQASRTNTNMTIFTVGLGVAFSMLIALLASVLLRRDNARRSAIETQLEKNILELHSANDQVEALAALGDALQSAQTVGEVARVTADRIAPMLRVDYLALSRRDGDMMRLENIWGDVPEATREQIKQPIQRSQGGLVWRVVEANTGINTQAYPQEQGALSLDLPGHAIAMEPVRGSNGEVTAVVAAGRAGSAGPWSQVELTMLERAATTLGLAFERAESVRALEELERNRVKQEAAAQAQALADNQKRFVSDASHELRAPLTAIQGNLELLLRYPNMPTTDRDEALHEASRESARLGRLVTDLLALARGDIGAAVQTDEVELKPVLLESWTQIRRVSPTHQFELLEISNFTIIGNRDRLKQLVLILLENATKYTPLNGTIKMSLKLVNRRAELRVIDTGSGIAAKDLPHVFERFYRADQSRTPGKDPGGTGLGLPIAHWITQLHGGEIMLESQEGHGTCVIVRLPYLEVAASPVQA